MEETAPKSCCSMKPAAVLPTLKVVQRAATPESAASAALPAEGKLQQYRPLIVILGVSLMASGALAYGAHLPFMRLSMGLFLAMLASLQLFSLPGFAKTFAGYDVVAKRLPLYGTAYPFIELALAGSYLAGTAPVVTNAVMLAIMAIGNIGVIQVMRSGARVQCACAGASFSLPVGRVTLAENTIMGLMALGMLVGH